LRNGGVSRYKKIKYFYEELLGKGISEEEILKYANIYSELTKEKLADDKYLIPDSIEFVRKNHNKYNMHIASGADEQDLIYICDSLGLSEYFISINGSPTTKSEIIGNILNSRNYKKDETCLIGDSISDLKAAEYNGIIFFGYNCTDLKHLGQYIDTFDEFE
jgi:HAD superfamily hydrolase (TIGR01549 family)